MASKKTSPQQPSFCDYLPASKKKKLAPSSTKSFAPFAIANNAKNANNASTSTKIGTNPTKRATTVSLSTSMTTSMTTAERNSGKKLTSTFMTNPAPLSARGRGGKLRGGLNTSSKKRSSSKKNSEDGDINTTSKGAKGVISKKDTATAAPSLTKINVQDYDIIHIDAHIKQQLKNKLSTIPELQKDLKTLLWIVNNSDDPLDRIQAKTQTSILRKRIQDIENSFEYGFYLLRTQDLLESYRKLFEKTKTRSFVSIGSEIVSEKLIAQKAALVTKYLRIAREYVQLEGITTRSSRLCCNSGDCCSTDFEQTDPDEPIYMCKQCGNTIELLDDAPTFKDTDRVNMASRYQYTCRGHFIEAMNKHEGKQNTTIPPGVKLLLEKEMKNHSLTPETTSKDHIYMFLSEKKLSAHYEDINLIYYMITGTDPPNITEYRPRLLELFDLQEEAYAEVKDPDRTNSLNVNYKLYKLLQLVGFDCKKDDFYILRTRAKLEEHDEKWREIIEILKKKHPDQPIWRFIATL